MDKGNSRPASSSSQALLKLIQHFLPKSSPDALVSSEYANALQLMANSSSSAVSMSEFAIVEKIKKTLMREGREQDAVTFQFLYQKLLRSNLLKHRDAILNLFLNLSEPASGQSGKGQQRFKKVAPFLVQDIRSRLQSTGIPNGRDMANGDTSHDRISNSTTSSYLSSIHDIRHQIGNVPAGYHPPIPPKPKSPISALVNSSTSKTLDSEKKQSNGKKLLRELIFAFQGIEGTIIRWNPRKSCYSIIESQKSQYSPSVIQMTQRLAELGWLHSKVYAFCKDLEDKKSEVGLTCQSLVTGLRNELSEYYRLLSTMEAQLQVPSTEIDLLPLNAWTLEPMNRMKMLVDIVETCRGKEGGELISTVYEYLDHGDESCSALVSALLCTVCKPMYLMLLRWICDGTIEDPHSEFFIAFDPKISGERLWHEKYSIRSSMIPKFLSLTWVKKILATGKSINFLHEVCHDNSPISGRDIVRANLDKTSPENLFSHPYGDNQLHRTIQRAFTDTSAHVLSVLFTRYKFLDHISALRKYLLLGQGDIIRYLLQLLEDELSQPASTLYPHNLSGTLETAIRATNAQYEDPEILDRLDVRLLDVQPGDTGWDVFSLDYKVAGPIGTVFGPEAMRKYLMLFNALWRAKRMEWILSCVWKQQAALHKMCKSVPELRPLLHIANLLTSEMIHFIHQLAYYITFEVMECSWDTLIKRLQHAESLDGVIEAHEDFLRTLIRQSLLDDSSQELLTQLRAIYDRILEFQGIQNQVYTAAIGEVESRLADQDSIRRRERKGQYGITESEEEGQRERKRTFNKIILPNLKSQLQIVSQSYQDMVRAFLLELACSQDQALQFLSFRLDFNQHYKRKDARLGTPLTFQHRRESMLSSSMHI